MASLQSFAELQFFESLRIERLHNRVTAIGPAKEVDLLTAFTAKRAEVRTRAVAGGTTLRQMGQVGERIMNGSHGGAGKLEVLRLSAVSAFCHPAVAPMESLSPII